MGKSLEQKKADLFGSIDALFAMFDKVQGIYNLLEAPSLNIDASVNPFELILGLLQHIGVSYDEMLDFLTKYLTYAIPALEMSTKAILLAQLKKSVSCSLDPRIPDELRTPAQQLGDDFDVESANRNGIVIDVDAIDLKGKLDGALNPDDFFGIGNNMNVHQLSRADDFDAFLWYVMHKAKFTGSQKGDTLQEALGEDERIIYGNNIFSPFMTEAPRNKSKLTPGKTVRLDDGKILSLCVQAKSANEGTDIIDPVLSDNVQKIFWPVSINWESANWYTNSKYYYGYNLGLSKSNFAKTQGQLLNDGLHLSAINKGGKQCIISQTTNRNYTEERAICNVKYLEDRTRMTDTLTNRNLNLSANDRSFVFTILPKPLIHFPSFKLSETTASATVTTTDADNNKQTYAKTYSGNVKITENPFRIKRFTFNESGDYDKNGQYTICGEISKCEVGGITTEVAGTQYGPSGTTTGYTAQSFTPTETVTTYRMTLNGQNADLYIGGKTGDFYFSKNWKTGPELYKYFLHPCYKGLTVYEFNYDFVMSLKLFDAKNILSGIFNALSSARIGANAHLSANFRRTETDELIHQIVKNIIESTDNTYSDCYYTFDNSKYDAQLRKAEDKRKRHYTFGEGSSRNIDLSDAYHILEEFNDNATLNVQQDILKRAITQATVDFTDNGDENNTKYSAKLGFLFNIVELLSRMFIEAILTPKVLFIFEVNKQLMGETTRHPSIKDVIENLKGAIVPIIRSIIDSIIQELITFILSKLEDLLLRASFAMIQEAITIYRELLNDIIKNCALFDWSFLRRTKLNSYLDHVDYADIEPATDEPITDKGNC